MYAIVRHGGMFLKLIFFNTTPHRRVSGSAVLLPGRFSYIGNIMHSMKIPTILLLATLLSGCIQKIAIGSMGTIMDNGFVVINEEQDLQLAGTAIASDLKLLESVLRSDPDNDRFLLLASMGYSSYALGFVEDDSAKRAAALYLRGKEFGMRILRKHAPVRDALALGPDEFRRALATLSNDDVPAVFWTATGWGSYIAVSLTDPEALVDLPKVEIMMRFVLEKDPGYFYSGANLFLGTLYGSRPKILGGDPDTSRKYFDECLRRTGGKYLMAYYYMARSNAVQTLDRELFDRCLTAIDTTSLDVLPEARLSNAVAKRRAALLRSKSDVLF